MSDELVNIAKAHWRPNESDEEHGQRVEACQAEAFDLFRLATKVELAAFHQAISDFDPYRGSPMADRKRSAAHEAYRQATATAYELFVKSFADLMRDGEVSQATVYEWDQLAVTRAMQQAAE